ncbi:DUF6285 domain-containing protein [Azohydromonas caseinilytica]|uniref:DUF6285 domain-containing protein n=1 Tax=Azohydromonas caseinilytica TaxID=2728836 RepID=A0A848FBA6_9BURK|nr:DUF6285 domain-containing protein [Azohydromonas caseinilytica]NML15603.1 hypothetical protein [Azohydromonas caseinilytica]
MRDHPDGAELLAAARALLRDTLLPALPAEHRHAALMIANAMGIAERQLRAGDAPAAAEWQSLHRLLEGETADEAINRVPAAGLDEELIRLNRLLVQRIRAGEADPGRPLHPGLRHHLEMVALQRLAESNPKALPVQD